jgi:hypothetical protein
MMQQTFDMADLEKSEAEREDERDWAWRFVGTTLGVVIREYGSVGSHVYQMAHSLNEAKASYLEHVDHRAAYYMEEPGRLRHAGLDEVAKIREGWERAWVNAWRQCLRRSFTDLERIDELSGCHLEWIKRFQKHAHNLRLPDGRRLHAQTDFEVIPEEDLLYMERHLAELSGGRIVMPDLPDEGITPEGVGF